MFYLDWHYFEIWPKIITLWRNSILFPLYYFSIPTHLSNLFSPWRRQRFYTKIGFHPGDILAVFAFNIIARIIGAVARTCVIIYGLIFMLISCVIFFLPVIIWPLIPILTYPLFLIKNPPKDQEAEYILESAGNDLNKLAKILFRHKMGKFILAHLGFPLTKSMLQHKFSQSSDQLQSQLTTSVLSQLFQKFSEIYPPLTAWLAQNNLKSEDVYQTAIWYEKLERIKPLPLIWDLTRIKNIQGIGHNWSYGFTVELDKFSQDLTSAVPSFPLLVERENEITQMERILLKTQGNNVLVVGEPGVARHLLVETLAYRILSGHAQKSLSHKRILSIDMHAAAAGKPSILEVKGMVSQLLAEANSAGNIIVCIDEIDKFVSSGEGRIDLSDVVAKFAKSTVGVIGITTPHNFHKFIKTNSSLSGLFETVNVEAFPKEKMMDVLQLAIAPILERKYKIAISYPAVLKTIEDADRYITATPFPAKAIELLDETCVWKISHPKRSEGFQRDSSSLRDVGTQNDILISSDIDAFLSEKMHMAIGSLKDEENRKLANLENLLHERIINQEEAIRVIASSLRRARLDVANPDKPIGSFLFLGPTGVGKTETAKALAHVYFNSSEKLNRFDMSQYQKEEGMERLIGSSKTGIPGELTATIADEPFSIILLDEFEKSDKQIYNLFLTLLDEGYISDATGRKISAKNNIIIATSNAGAEFVRQKINQGILKGDLSRELIEYIQTEKIFSPELLNRFDAVVVFTPLSEGHLREIARLMLNDLNKRLAPKEISLEIDAELIRKIAVLGFDPQFGARAMKRAISENIEDKIAQKILRGETHKGEKIKIEL